MLRAQHEDGTNQILRTEVETIGIGGEGPDDTSAMSCNCTETEVAPTIGVNATASKCGALAGVADIAG